MGTRNRLYHGGPDHYLELIAIDPAVSQTRHPIHAAGLVWIRRMFKSGLRKTTTARLGRPALNNIDALAEKTGGILGRRTAGGRDDFKCASPSPTTAMRLRPD
jgi:hypothetical protein